MKEEQLYDYRTRTDAILMGSLSGHFDKMLSDRSNRLAYTLLFLLKQQHYKVYPLDDSKLGTDQDLKYIERTENIKAIEIELDFEWYRQDLGIFIGFEKDTDIPMIMRPKKRGRYEAYDPITESSVIVDSINAGSYQRKGLMVYPNYFDEKMSIFSLIFKSMKLQKTDIVVYIVLSLIVALLGMMVSFAVGIITEGIQYENQISHVTAIGCVMLSSVAVSALYNTVINRTKYRITSKTKTGVYIAFICRVMNISSSDERKVSSSLIALLLPFLNSVGTVIDSAFVISLNLIQVLLILIVMSLFGSLTVHVLQIVLIYIVAMILLQLVTFRISRRLNEENISFTNMRGEFLDNIETIKNNAAEERMMYRFAVSYDEYMTLKLKRESISQWVNLIGTFISGFGVFMIYMAVAFGNPDSSSFSYIAAIVALFTMMLNYVRMMIDATVKMIDSRPQLKVADEILHMPVEAEENSGEYAEISGEIEFSHVNFSYNKNTAPIIKDLSLHILPGEYVGIVGGSGCGKSTLIRLLMGFEKPDTGNILFDGMDQSQIDITSLRRQTGAVLQDASVMTGSIRMNIGLSEDADMELVRHAAQMAAIDEDIEAMPMKYNTVVSSEAELISGGQRQRIVLARALMNHPKILILDEATSAMDNISQSRVKANLDEMGVTRIVVAHRLSTIQDCDRILVLDKGKLVEEGDFDTLIAKDGLFAKMARRNLT